MKKNLDPDPFDWILKLFSVKMSQNDDVNWWYNGTGNATVAVKLLA